MGTTSRLKKWLLRLSAVAVPLWMGIVVVVVTILLVFDLPIPLPPLYLASLVACALAWFFGGKLKGRPRFVFFGSFLGLLGVFLLALDLGLVPIPLKSSWPILLFFISVALVAAGISHYRRAHPIFLVPALAFSALACIFLLFSTHVIQDSIATSAQWWFPVFFLPPLIAVALWVAQRVAGRRKRPAR